LDLLHGVPISHVNRVVNSGAGTVGAPCGPRHRRGMVSVPLQTGQRMVAGPSRA
jgi:hypothetical protein